MNGQAFLTIFNNSDESMIVPVYDGYSISLTFRFTDITKFNSEGSFSSSFRCPMTAELTAFLGAVYDPNHIGWFDPRRKIKASLSVDTTPVSNGSIQLNSIVTQKTGRQEIELTFFGETPDLARDLSGKYLSDIEALSSLDHTLNYANVTDDSLNSGDTVYTLLDKGQNFSELGEVGTTPVFNAALPLYPSDFTPTVPARWIWDEIMSDAGYIVESPSNFPDVLDDYYVPWYNGTIAPIPTNDTPIETNVLRLDTDDSFFLNVFDPVHNYFSTMTVDVDNGSNITGNYFTAPFSGVFRFRYYVNFSPSGPDFSGRLVKLMLVDNATPPPTAQIWAQSFVNSVNNVDKQVSIDVELTLESGDEVHPLIWIDINFPNSVEVNGFADSNPAEGTGFEMYEVVSQEFGYTVDMVANAPIMSQLDFINSIRSMHNLVVIPDRNIPRKLRIEPISDYLGSGAVKDWTAKLDLNKDRSQQPPTNLQAKDIRFSYTEDSDVLNKLFKDETDRIFGELNNEDSDYFESFRSDFATGSLKIESKFAPTPCNNINGTAIPIPKFINESGQLFKAKPRILYWAFSPTGFQVFNDGTTAVASTTVRVLSNFDSVDIGNQSPGVQDNDLNFGAESVYLQQVFGAPYNNLFNLYWRDYLREIYDSTARIFTGHFALTLPDILQFSFADQIYIQDSYWRILEINSFGMGEGNTTEVKLLKVLTANTECASRPLRSNLDGTVTFINNADEEIDPSQSCCELYGYTYDSDREVCVWNANNSRSVQLNATQGTGNFGAGVNNSTRTPQGVVGVTQNSAIKQDNFGTFTGGNELTVGQGNAGSAIFGDRNVTADGLNSVAVFGTNADVYNKGLHFGGGFLDGSRENHVGRMQFGTIPLVGYGDWESINDKFEVLVSGTDRINIPNNTAWALTCNVTFGHIDAVSGNLDTWQQQLYQLVIYKSNDLAGVVSSQIAPYQEDGNLSAHIELEIDVTTDTDEHRFSLIADANTGLPLTDVQASMAIHYVQSRLS